MKTKFLFMMIAGLAIALFSCNSDKDVPGADEDGDDGAIHIPRYEANPEFELILNVSEDSPWTWRYTDSELQKIDTLFALIPESVKKEYDKKYVEWEKTWRRPEIRYYGDLFSHKRSDEYEDLLNFSKQFGKSAWALLFEKSATKTYEEGVHFAANLWVDLTFSEYKDLFEVIYNYFYKQVDFNLWIVIGRNDYVYIVYSRNLLKLEYDNILQSIKDNFYPEE